MAFKRVVSVWNIVLAACAVMFFIGSLILWMPTGDNRFISPDETANYWSAKTFASDWRLWQYEPMNLQLDSAIHPRSMTTTGDRVVPVGFLGLPVIYGLLTRVVGAWSILMWTPVIALLAVFAWQRLLRRWFDNRVANIATVVTLFHPALWYYTARGLMPNVLFVALLIFSAFFWFERPTRRSVSTLISGVLLGLAFFVRASEVYWLCAILIGLTAVYWKSIDKRDLVTFVIGGLIGITPFFAMNFYTYGHALTTGYTLTNSVAEVTVIADVAPATSLLFPFGFDILASARNILSYGLSLFWWLTLPALVGFISLSRRSRANRQTVFLIVFTCLAIWLGVWYGSWVIHDNPDPTQVTLANSYVRYWLPVFVLSTPLVAIGIEWIVKRTHKKVLHVLLFCVISAGAISTFFGPQDGLLAVRSTITRSLEILTDINNRVESDSIIVVDRADKLFYPHRVVYPLRSRITYDLMPRMVEYTTLYYYGITFPEEDLVYLNTRKLFDLGLRIEHVKTYDEESLYRIFKQ